jgi:hypothetical protein
MHTLRERLVGAGKLAGLEAPQFFVPARPGDAVARHVPIERAHVRRIHRQAQPFFALCQPARVAAQLQPYHHLPAHHPQRLLLCRTQLARDPVEHTQRADRLSVRRHERRSRIEADVRVAGDERIVDEAFINVSVRHDEQTSLKNAVPAEGDVAWCLLRGHSHPRLEPLALLIDERDQRHRGLAEVRHQGGQLIELRFRVRVEPVVLSERHQALCLVVRSTRSFHGILPEPRRTNDFRREGRTAATQHRYCVARGAVTACRS